MAKFFNLVCYVKAVDDKTTVIRSAQHDFLRDWHRKFLTEYRSG